MMPDDTESTRPRRSLLFTPANRPTAFTKALASGADIVCLDLEDAVPPDQKAAARAPAINFLMQSDADGPQHALRINAVNSHVGLEDLTAVLRAAPRHGMILLPKVSEAAELHLVDTLLSEVRSSLELGALIETLDGLENVAAIAQATPRLKLMVFGAVDFSAELGTDNADAPLAYARGKVIHAAKRAGIDVMDVPSLNFSDLDGIGQAARHAQHLGFTGKAAIHPTGVDEINTAFTPSAEEIEQAKRVIAAYEASPNGLAVLDGRLVEAPVVKAMQRRLAIAASHAQNEADPDA
ncbi:HpcH/HpaI aldolase/citrate lyase family protein [Sulfitobacter sp.]|uniref:HpcH/HpaI aldolase/citrate lyase family protein n=1 Tax=Sulfitobacter sp. TaxID=1903071 RepID=UPI00300288C0